MRCIHCTFLTRRELVHCRVSLFSKRSWPTSLKLARAHELSHNIGTKACAPLPVLALLLIHLHNVHTRRRSSCCFLTFSQTPALRHWLCVLYIHTHSCKFRPRASQLMSALWISSTPGWLSQVFLATNFLRFQRKEHVSLHCNLQYEAGQQNACAMEQRVMLAD